MNSKTPIKLLVMFALILALALSAAVPGTVQAQSDLVRLTVENKTSSIMYMWLTGPGIYYLRIPAGETAVYTVERGEYNYKQYACGATTQSIVDLSTQQKLIMPICGGRAVTAGKISRRGRSFGRIEDRFVQPDKRLQHQVTSHLHRRLDLRLPARPR